MIQSNMAPGSENDPRSGCDDDAMDCVECNGATDECPYCHGEGIVSEREYKATKAEEREDLEANQ